MFGEQYVAASDMNFETLLAEDISSSSTDNNEHCVQNSWFFENDFMRLNSDLPEPIFAQHSESQINNDAISVGCVSMGSEIINGDEIDVGCEEDVRVCPLKQSLFTKNKPFKSKKYTAKEENNVEFDIRPMNTYEEKELLKNLNSFFNKFVLPAELYRLRRKLIVRSLKREHNLPLLDVDADFNYLNVHDNLVDDKEKMKPKLCKMAPEACILDRFQIPRGTVICTERSNGSFSTKLAGVSPQHYIFSPYSLRKLKPFIFRDYESRPQKLQLMEEIHSQNDTVSSCRYPIDYCYVTPQHIPAMNSLACQFFWPGIELSEVLQYPDHTCVVLYRSLVIGFGIIVPDVCFSEAYISFLLVHPDWRKAGIAKFILYHLIQTCIGKDITIHVSATNSAILLYQRFGFKVEEFLVNFYDKYLPQDSPQCKHAMLMRLSR